MIVTLPDFLMESRQEIEGRFVMALWKEPDLYEDYKDSINISTDLMTDDGVFYYTMGLRMHELNFKVFDVSAIDAFLSERPTSRDEFELRGGYDSVRDIRSLVDESNVETYYDELLKSNAIIELYNEGFDVQKYHQKFINMTYQQLEDFVEYKLNNIFLRSSSSGMTVADLTSNYDKWIEKWDTGEGVGYPIGFKMMNYHLAGIHKKNLILHLGGIGQGKTTSAISMYVLPVLEAGEKICVIANEQDEEQFRQMILATVLFNRINYRKMNRQKLLFGGFTKEDKLHLLEAAKWLEKYNKQLHYVHLTDYGTANVKRLIKKYSKLGVGIFLFDTLKPTDESSDRAWAEFSETAKMLFTLAQKEDVAIVATAQLSAEASKRKFLDLSCIGKSRAIAETAGQVIMFRPIKDSEKENLFVYNYHKNQVTGKYGTAKQEVTLEKDKDYVVFFIPKNRYGSTDIQIVCERNMAFNYYKEIGYCQIEYDGFGK